MNTVTISSEYQIVIPREIREPLGLKPGTKLIISCNGNRITLRRALKPADLFGKFPDLPSFQRERDEGETFDTCD